MLRRRVEHTQSLETRLSEEAKSLREKAKKFATWPRAGKPITKSPRNRNGGSDDRMDYVSGVAAPEVRTKAILRSFSNHLGVGGRESLVLPPAEGSADMTLS